MGNENAFVRGFEKQAKKMSFLEYLKNPRQAEKALKDTVRYKGGRALLGASIPTAGAVYIGNKIYNRSDKGGLKSQVRSPTPNYY